MFLTLAETILKSNYHYNCDDKSDIFRDSNLESGQLIFNGLQKYLMFNHNKNNNLYGKSMDMNIMPIQLYTYH